MMVLFCGFLAIYTIFLDIPLIVKIISVFSFVHCFVAKIPYTSFTTFVSIVASVYFFVLCLRIKNWDIVFKVIQGLLFLNMVLLVFQYFDHDNLLNFGRKTECVATIGQYMQAGSMAVILAAMLISYNKFNILYPFITCFIQLSQWTVFSSILGSYFLIKEEYRKIAKIILIILLAACIGYAWKSGKLKENSSCSGRYPVWKETLHLIGERPYGYGAGSYKILFPIMSQQRGVPYKSPHNDYLKIGFEMGIPGLILMMCLFLNILVRVLIFGTDEQLAGLIMIMVNMVFHFPMCCIQAVPVIIVYFAYCWQKAEEKRREPEGEFSYT